MNRLFIRNYVKSIETAGAEVQKGNPVEERKIQRLLETYKYRNEQKW